MFCAVALTDVEVAKKITAECGGAYDDDDTMHLVFILDDKVSGIASARFIEKTVRITYVGLIKEARGKGYGDFLTRSMINKVMDLSDAVEVNVVDDYFIKFGFKVLGNIMRADSKSIVFPSKCQHRA